MIWKGHELRTHGEYTNALAELQTKEEAAEFVRLAREENPEHADKNLGYLTGYLSVEEGERIRELINIPHPVFGMKITMSAEEILRTGYERGKKLRK